MRSRRLDDNNYGFGLVNVVRGNVMTFKASPLDNAGAPVTPASVTLHVVYFVSAVETTATVAMTNTAGVWSGTWDTTPADAGQVFWSIRAASPTAAQDGQFALVANLANPA